MSLRSRDYREGMEAAARQAVRNYERRQREKRMSAGTLVYVSPACRDCGNTASPSHGGVSWCCPCDLDGILHRFHRVDENGEPVRLPDSPVCEDTGATSIDGACSIHGGDACLTMFETLTLTEARYNEIAVVMGRTMAEILDAQVGERLERIRSTVGITPTKLEVAMWLLIAERRAATMRGGSE